MRKKLTCFFGIRHTTYTLLGLKDAMPSSAPAISELTSAVFDTGRRGNPKPGCDCVQCFGFCLVDRDEAMRVRFDSVRAAPDDFLFTADFHEDTA